MPREELFRYGIVTPVGPLTHVDGVDSLPIAKVIEKPHVDDAPSDLAIIGRYALTPDIFDVLDGLAPGGTGEIQLTDAVDVLATRGFDGAGGGLTGVVFSGRRYDTGDRLEYLKAVVQLAMEHQDLGPAFSHWLRDFVRQDSSG